MKKPEEEVPRSHVETPTSQEKIRRRFEEQGARPKTYRRQQEERWQLLSGEQMRLKIPIQDVQLSRESRQSDQHSDTRRPSSSLHRPSSSHQRSSTTHERPSATSSPTSHQSLQLRIASPQCHFQVNLDSLKEAILI